MVGIDVRRCISYIKFEPFLRFGLLSLKFNVLFAAKWLKKGFSNQFDAQNAGKLAEGQTRGVELGIWDCRAWRLRQWELEHLRPDTSDGDSVGWNT